MLLTIRQLRLASWILTLVAVCLALGGIALGLAGEGFGWSAMAMATTIIGLQRLNTRSRRVLASG
ncbi:hypothetical protein T35B1_17576 [Salinisphaera shabanensis T35B1]|uniref:Uncharacterized protein n=1 Tax=Salinisphaera shabanensis E1L3A TaxID=1033802 RepID=U2EGC0_9GAMM|nr:hypothetical protein [Salinisphaera shabanensis]ERJ17462.1 hypothetical protein SSPSH_003720 [Salinisphaera shabanensis E1L3A]